MQEKSLSFHSGALAELRSIYKGTPLIVHVLSTWSKKSDLGGEPTPGSHWIPRVVFLCKSMGTEPNRHRYLCLCKDATPSPSSVTQQIEFDRTAGPIDNREAARDAKDATRRPLMCAASQCTSHAVRIQMFAKTLCMTHSRVAQPQSTQRRTSRPIQCALR